MFSVRFSRGPLENFRIFSYFPYFYRSENVTSQLDIVIYQTLLFSFTFISLDLGTFSRTNIVTGSLQFTLEIIKNGFHWQPCHNCSTFKTVILIQFPHKFLNSLRSSASIEAKHAVIIVFKFVAFCLQAFFLNFKRKKFRNLLNFWWMKCLKFKFSHN